MNNWTIPDDKISAIIEVALRRVAIHCEADPIEIGWGQTDVGLEMAKFLVTQESQDKNCMEKKLLMIILYEIVGMKKVAAEIFAGESNLDIKVIMKELGKLIKEFY